MLDVRADIQIHESEFTWSFVRSGGPGGQNVNKVASKAVLRWNVDQSAGVPDTVKARLKALHRKRITDEGDFVISSQRYRDQERNRLDCLEKLREWVLQAATVPRTRRATKPSRAAKARRVANKRHRSATKAGRRKPAEE